MQKRPVCLVAILVLAVILSGGVGDAVLVAQATNANDVRNNIDKLNKELDEINKNIVAWEEKQDILEEEMADLNAEIINTMTSISMKEDEIEETSLALGEKEKSIEKATEEYEEAKAIEEKQYEDMVVRLRKMYENGEESSLQLLLSGNGLADMLNQLDFMESIYSYDRKKLDEFNRIKNQVLDLWNRLEVEKAELETAKQNLEIDKLNLMGQKSDLDALLSKKKQQSANYEAEIKKAKQEASVAKTKLQQEKEALKKLQQGGGKTPEGDFKSDYSGVIDKANGSEQGKKIAKYACQFIGNPYVPGGTSLTKGADCSGFTYRVYSDFGYSIPRTSTQQRSAGKGVTYSEAQPGDLICYSGHVGMYIGGGLIVHASTQKTGIKVSNATYREILAVRRIL